MHLTTPPRFKNQKHDDEVDQELDAQLLEMDEELDKYDPERQRNKEPEVCHFACKP